MALRRRYKGNEVSSLCRLYIDIYSSAYYLLANRNKSFSVTNSKYFPNTQADQQ